MIDSSVRIATLVLGAALLTLGCGAGVGDDTEGQNDSPPSTGSGAEVTSDGTAQENEDGAQGCLVEGCANGQHCCTGIPYPEEGECAESCTMRSDRTVKHGVASVDPQAVLDAVTRLPVSAWSYDSEPGVRHLGPMAQDFHAAFGVGADPRRIEAVDANGVLLLAVQALERRVSALEAENRRLRESGVGL